MRVDPLLELLDRPRVQRRERADDAGLALGDDQLGPETMNSGEPITGSSSVSTSEAGNGIQFIPSKESAASGRPGPFRRVAYEQAARLGGPGDPIIGLDDAAVTVQY